MSNANYNKQTAAGYGSGKGSAPKARKGHFGAEHDSVQKDDPIKWPKVPSGGRPSINSGVKFPIVKTRVVSQNVD